MSLRWKILARFFINLTIIGLLICGFLLVQFRLGISSLIAGSTDDRLEAIAQPLVADLRRLPADQWAGALDQAVAVWRRRGLEAALFLNNGTSIAGDIKALPTEVRHELGQHEARHHPGPPGRGGPLPGPPPEDHFGPQPSGEPLTHPPALPDKHFFGPGSEPGIGHWPPPQPHSQDPPSGQSGHFGGPGGPPPDRAPTPGKRLDKFMLVAGQPRLYWTGVYLDGVQRPTPGGPKPGVTLVLASSSLSGGGLFFDYKPWLALGGALVLISILWWLPFVHGLTRSLASMTGVAEDIAHGCFHPQPSNSRRDELGRLGRALSHMSVRLEGFATGQKRFLGDTAHELLSPLARLEVALSILEQKIALPGDRRYLDRSLDEVRRMSVLVNDLLAYTKAGLRAQAAEVRPVALAEIARQAVAREAAEERVTVEVPEECRVCADPDLLLRALSNGVRNAVRYAGEAGPIAISIAPMDPSKDEVAVSVVDQGSGVPPETISRLFDPFFRPEDARTRETGGTGLGLAIVKSCIEACGGSVSVHNRLPGGLQLTFHLKPAER